MILDKKGVISALWAFGLWGVVPLYWKMIDHIPAFKILGQRIVWALLFYQLLILIRSKGKMGFGNLWQILRQPKFALLVFVASALLCLNWGLYIWAVNANHVVETSLGYFINPLLNIALGVLLLKENLSTERRWALGIAMIGVLVIGLEMGRWPWIALSLAASFGLYGFIRKLTGLGGLEGGRLESLFMLPVAGFLWLWPVATSGPSADLVYSGWDWVILVGSGPVTALPLYFFAEAAVRLPLNILGFLQYIAPTLQFLIGVVIFQEPFGWLKACGFALIWLALAICSREFVQKNLARATAGRKRTRVIR